MKVLFVGGAGDMGRVGVSATASDPAVESVVVADRFAEGAREVAEHVGSKAQGIGLDINDRGSLEAALADVDLVMNTVGPFYRFGRPVLEAAIRTGTNYVDIMDDWEPTADLLDLDDEAKGAGIVAVLGAGASPGVSNVLAAAAAAQLDEVDVLHTVWRAGSGIPRPPDPGEEPQPSAAIEHWLHNLSVPAPVWREGCRQHMDPLEKLSVSFPGVGPVPVWLCGHPEPLTLPRTYRDLKECYNLMTSRPGLMTVATRIADKIRSGSLTLAEGTAELLRAPGRRGPEAGELPDVPGLFALAEGSVKGVPTRIAASTPVLPVGSMGESTSIPLAVVGGMIARGEIARPGVMAPESIVDPGLFFERLAGFGNNESSQPLELLVEEI